MKKRSTAIFFLIVYSAILVNVMVFKNLPVVRIGAMRFKFGGKHEGPANLVPFKTISLYLLSRNGLIAGLNLVGNIVLLVPIGLLVPFIYRHITWKKMLVIAVAAGLVIECMQVVFRVGIFDIDDLILNGLGVMLGYWVFIIFTKMTRLRQPELV